jgi:hypothetical protein
VSRITFIGCLAGIALALALFEKMFRLSTENDFHTAMWEEAASPLGLTSKAPSADGPGGGKALEKSDRR